jgi:DNA polymerase alpha subunit A
LTKEPSSYADARTQPHVTVALRMRQKGLSASSGDTIPYVICQQSSAPIENNSNSTTLADFAYHPDEVRKDGTLRLDVSWYLQTQLHPPIARLCEHIEGTDSSQLAACLGLDPRKFRSSSNSSNSDDSLLNSSASSRFASLLTDEERFAHVEKLKIVCPSCSSHFEFAGIIKEEPESLSSLLNCAQCSAPLSVTSLYYAAILSLRKASDNYNSFWMKCDEVGCQLETERLGVYDRRCPSDGCKGVLRPRLPHSYLYTHLLYLRSLFSTEKIQTRLANKLTPADTKLLQHLAAVVEPVTTFIDQNMQQCAYPVISFKQIFGFLHGSNEE